MGLFRAYFQMGKAAKEKKPIPIYGNTSLHCANPEPMPLAPDCKGECSQRAYTAFGFNITFCCGASYSVDVSTNRFLKSGMTNMTTMLNPIKAPYK